jgi:hypothetical protein
MSNTFEATVNYTLTDPSGKSLGEGYTTATAGPGTWGTFAFDVTFVSKRPGLGRLAVYEISPKDGCAPVDPKGPLGRVCNQVLIAATAAEGAKAAVGDSTAYSRSEANTVRYRVPTPPA